MPPQQPSLQRHYPLQNLNFRDFWDICSHYQRVNPTYQYITYSVEGSRDTLVDHEPDVARVLRKLSAAPDEPIRKYTARFYPDLDQAAKNEYGSTKLVYLPSLSDFQDAGLYYYGLNETKLSLFKFEDLLYSNYALSDNLPEVEAEFGVPCEALAVNVDMRGFTRFCDQPNIESPYTCGLMTSFYNLIKNSFIKFPPDLMKFNGDGVLAVWQTSAEDREIAIDTAIEGLSCIPSAWLNVLQGPHFSHGAPEGIGSGMAFGLASKISVANDFIGRPVNMASRLCAICPADEVFIDKGVPNIHSKYALRQRKVELRSYGPYTVWVMP